MPKKEAIRKRSESKGYSWFSWRRNNQAEETEENKTKKLEEPTQQVFEKLNGTRKFLFLAKD